MAFSPNWGGVTIIRAFIWRGSVVQTAFPSLTLLPDLAGFTGCYLHSDSVVFLCSIAATDKTLYKLCVLFLNKWTRGWIHPGARF